jgi:predicted RNA binding protein YcfA (HicA-like mRNA interferase family)
MKSITGIELCQKLNEVGWLLKCIRGNHHIFGKAGARSVISVPVQDNQNVKLGLANRIAKETGVSW